MYCSPEKKILCDNIKHICTEQGITIPELARRLEVTERSLKRRLTGDFSFRPRHIVQLCKVLQVPLSKLFQGIQTMQNSIK